MVYLILFGVVIVILVIGAVVVTRQQESKAAAIGLRYDKSGERFIESLPFTRFAGVHEVDVDAVLAGERDGRRAWLFELELERIEAGVEIDDDFTGAVIELAAPPEPFVLGGPVGGGSPPEVAIQFVTANPVIVTVEVAGPYLLVLTVEQPPSKRPDVLDLAADLARNLSAPM